MSRARREPAARRRDILTPEGVRLTVTIADVATRAAAALIDALFVVVTFGVLLFAFAFLGLAAGPAVVALAALAVFLGRILYFPLFELHRNGRTPGKSRLGLRVIGRNGAPLDGRAVLARNAVREVEFWLPLTYLVTASEPDFWAYAATLGWLGCVAAVPLMNRERMRGGDILAGTWVIEEPAATLHRDLLAHDASPASAAPPFAAEAGGPAVAAEARQAAPEFTAAQLDAYGAKELEVLADVLFDLDNREEAARKAGIVAAAIRAKIGYAGPPTDDRAFLAAYYRAARAKMESDAQWGRLKSDKHARRDPRSRPPPPTG
jgi:uncharacterized RDD family membrane protein YckC